MQATVIQTGALGSRDSAAVVRRFAAPVRRPSFWIALWAAALAAEVIVVAALVTTEEAVSAPRVVFRLVGGVFAVCGLIAWRRRPDSTSGPLMLATGFGLLIEPVVAQLDWGPIRFFGDLFEDAWGIPMIALLLSFSSNGREFGTAERLLVGATVLQLALEIIRHLFLVRDGNVLLGFPNARAADAILAISLLLTVVACLGTAVVIGVRWMRASPPRRRAMLPSVAGISTLLLFGTVQISSAPWLMVLLAVSSLLLVPVGFLAVLLRSRLARGGVADLFGEISTMRGAELQARLARAAGDPSLTVAHEAGDGFADVRGAPVAIPPAPGRAFVSLAGGALVYDAALDEDPGLIEVIGAAAAIALGQERQEASRQRLIVAGDAERRRLERDLHDGAQQRLVMVAIQLRLIRADIRRDPAAAEALVNSASGELARSLEELRELARGIHPAVLEHGLASALASLCSRSPVPTAVDCDALGDVPRPVELALYFVACEALANVGKYAHAATAAVTLRRSESGLALEIADDGIGGAHLTAGSGLRGLQDRVEALRGHLIVTSPVGAGTVVIAEVPCAS